MRTSLMRTIAEGRWHSKKAASEKDLAISTDHKRAINSRFQNMSNKWQLKRDRVTNLIRCICESHHCCQKADGGHCH